MWHISALVSPCAARRFKEGIVTFKLSSYGMGSGPCAQGESIAQKTFIAANDTHLIVSYDLEM